jgi:ELWxxDGT repeat protein
MNGVAYFFADDGIHGFELWKSDGTSDGTQLFKDIISGENSAFSIRNTIISSDLKSHLILGKGSLFFQAYKSIEDSSSYLWKLNLQTNELSSIDDVRDFSQFKIIYNKIIFYKNNSSDLNKSAYWIYDEKEKILKSIDNLTYQITYPYLHSNPLIGMDIFTNEFNDNIYFTGSFNKQDLNIWVYNAIDDKIQSLLNLPIEKKIKILENFNDKFNINPDKYNYSYEIGGIDAKSFNIDIVGNLRFNNIPDFERAVDYNYDNIYKILVNKCDTEGGCILESYEITVQDIIAEPLQLQVKALLQGAYDSITGLMRDDLRQQAYIPIESPYFSQTQVTAELNPVLLTRNDETAPVDWVLVELRDKNDKTKILVTKSALIQRDGQIIDAQTGDNILSWANIAADNYFVAIKHRNHLGIMSNDTVALGTSIVSMDFTSSAIETLGTNSRLIVIDKALMWAGDSNQDGMLIANGSNSDTTTILGNLLMDPTNVEFNSNYMPSGYFDDDINLDGNVAFAGPNNDITPLIANILVHPENTETAGNYIVKAGF